LDNIDGTNCIKPIIAPVNIEIWGCRGG